MKQLQKFDIDITIIKNKTSMMLKRFFAHVLL